ncbi:hypothetical protein WA026_008938 [Henosepilachna vigintioctopunctata]|uniref:Acyl-CoA synthetase short-chain family member 3, mitochondrial n=1 Tax=Henosepilachna vigintioctopunctata TaxID=420089 RepID=A0AAW1VDQ5_9CUCU
MFNPLLDDERCEELDGKIQDIISKRIKHRKLDQKNKFEKESHDAVKENLYPADHYHKIYKKSLSNPEEFWGEIAKCVEWSKPWDRVLDNRTQPFTKWFVGGEINACHNAVDRHVKAGKGSKVALIHDSPLTKTVRRVTYAELLDEVSHLAGALAKLGVTKGDRVLIYMPLIPEAIVSMLATARLGAVHSVVFGGFASRELCTRIIHSEPKVIIAASCGLEPHRIIRYKEILNEAIEMSSYKPHKCIIFQRRNVESCSLDVEMDLLWEDALKMAGPHECVPVEANDPLYILYTSGTTDQPKGIQRPVGGHIATLCWTMSTVYGMGPEDVWWAASDLGWVVGHSYICYGPLLAGITSVMYEGKPDRTPDPGQYFRIINEHKVNGLFSVPTAFRVIKREDPEVEFGRKYSLKSLKAIIVAGEHCDYETKAWAERVFNAPVLNQWWQTETGHAMAAHCIGLGHSMNPPKYTAGMAFPGYDIKILRKDGTEAVRNELGRIVVKLPLPPGTMSCLYQAPERFCQVYFQKYPGYYDTMDAGYIDEYGYIYVTARDDDVINVAGHRISTSALEDVVLAHPDVVDATVVGVPEPTKGEVPLCLFVMKKDTQKTEAAVSRDILRMVRQLVGPIAAFRLAVAVTGLPHTRSGKICRKSISDLARNKEIRIPGTVEDPSVYKNIKITLQKLGYACSAPDPQ